MIVRTFINNVETNDPINLKALGIELNFDKGSPKAIVSTNDWDIGVGSPADPNDGLQITQAHITSGLTSGGNGVFIALPFRIIVEHLDISYTLFDGYLDTSKALVGYQGGFGKITAPAAELGMVDWLNEVADSVSFEYLFEEKKSFDSSYFIPVPYVISKKANPGEVVLAFLTVFAVTSQISDQIIDITEKTVEAANPFEASVIARLVIRILYITTLVIALIKLILDVFNQLVQPVKYHMGMYLKDLLTIGAAHFGLTFKSSIFIGGEYDKVACLPQKYNIKEDNTGTFKDIVGWFTPDVNDQNGYYKGTYGQLLRSLITLINGKIIITDTEIYLEREDFNLSVPFYTLPPREEESYRFNSDELKANTYLEFQTDINDRNTLQEFVGTSVQAIRFPNTLTDPRSNLMRNLEQITFDYALGKRKTELSIVEKIFDVFFKAIGAVIGALVKVLNAIIKVINRIIKIINKIIKTLGNLGIKIDFEIPEIPQIKFNDFSNLIEDRIGMLKMETDFISVPKLIMVDRNSEARNNKLLPQNESILNAKYLYENYHFIKSFAPSAARPNANQWKLYQATKIPFTFSDYQLVRSTNKMETSDEREALIDSLKWNPTEQIADVNYRVNELYTLNINEKLIEPTGK
jgi:hypothetical protein